jgi:hypothetical protein
MVLRRTFIGEQNREINQRDKTERVLLIVMITLATITTTIIMVTLESKIRLNDNDNDKKCKVIEHKKTESFFHQYSL